MVSALPSIRKTQVRIPEALWVTLLNHYLLALSRVAMRIKWDPCMLPHGFVSNSWIKIKYINVHIWEGTTLYKSQHGFSKQH